MKRYKKILMIWICAIVVVAVSVIVALYDNANQGQDVAKEVAVETLRKVAERVVNREFDGLGMFYAFGSEPFFLQTEMRSTGPGFRYLFHRWIGQAMRCR